MGAQLRGFGQVSVAARTILGVAVVCSITPEVLSQLPQMAGSVALIPIYVILIGLVGVPFFHKICRFDPVTAGFAHVATGLGLAHPVEAFLAFAPGGQAEMTVLAIVAGADLGFVIAHHLARIVLVITGAPLVASLLGRSDPRD